MEQRRHMGEDSRNDNLCTLGYDDFGSKRPTEDQFDPMGKSKRFVEWPRPVEVSRLFGRRGQSATIQKWPFKILKLW